jgi:hypothetical protein
MQDYESKSALRLNLYTFEKLPSGSSHPSPQPRPSTARLLLAALAGIVYLLTACACPAQSIAGSNWQNVRVLPLGITLDVKTRSQHLSCKLNSVTDDTLSCDRGAGGIAVLQRTDVAWVKVRHRGRSALIGAAIGGGGLGIAAFAATTSKGNGFFGSNLVRGPATAVGLLGGGIIGAGIGALTGFSKSTVYKAP